MVLLTGIPLPELSFGGVLFGLLALMWLGGRAMRTEGRSVAEGRRGALAALYAILFVAFIGPVVVTSVLFSIVGVLLAMELKAAFAASRALRFGPAPTALLLLPVLALPWLGPITRVTGIAAPIYLAAFIGSGIGAALLSTRPSDGFVLVLVSLTAAAALDLFCWLRTEPHGTALCLFVFFLINVADTSAYFSGKLFGRHKLAPTISPGKTIEGSLGSIVVTLACAFLFARVLELPFTAAQVACVAFILNVLGQAGDLLASWLKRRLGLKDFGTLLRGHGGILDRFDSCLLAVPAFVCGWRWLA